MRRLLPATAAIAVIALLVWAFLPDVPSVETAAITRTDLTVRIDAEGEARIREVITVSAPIAGVLQRITLHPGDKVAAGQTVARIGPVASALLDARSRAVAQASVAAAAAAVDLARSQGDQAEAAQDYARTEADRTRALFARAALSWTTRSLPNGRPAPPQPAPAPTSPCANANWTAPRRFWTAADPAPSRPAAST